MKNFTYVFLGWLCLMVAFPFSSQGEALPNNELFQVERLNCNSLEVALTDNFLADGQELLIVEIEVTKSVWKRHSSAQFTAGKVVLEDLNPNHYRLKVLPSNKMQDQYGSEYYQLNYIRDIGTLKCGTATETKLSIFPNPTQHSLNIGGILDGIYDLRIYDNMGREYLFKIDDTNRNVDLHHLAAGVYHLVLKNEEEILTTKMVKID